jgi:hypothetical protein
MAAASVTAESASGIAIREPATLAEEAFRRRYAEFSALVEGEIVPANLDVTSAIAMVLAAIPKLKAASERLALYLANFSVELFALLEDYAWALHYTQGAYLIAVPAKCSPEALKEARGLRKYLLRGLQTQAARKQVSPARWEGLHRGPGRAHLAMDLNILVQVHEHYAKHGSELDGTPIESGLASREELGRAIELSRLILATGVVRRLTPEMAAAENLRNRVFTKLARTYEIARQSVAYVRCFEPDVCLALPSLWQQRRRGKQRRSETAAEAQGAARIPAAATARAVAGEMPTTVSDAPAPSNAGSLAPNPSPSAPVMSN